AGRQPDLRPAAPPRDCASARRRAKTRAARRAGGWARSRRDRPALGHDPGGRGVRHHRAVDRARHGARDEHRRPGGGARFRPENRAGRAGGGAGRPGGDRSVSRNRGPMSELAYFAQILLSGVGVGCIYGLIGIGFCVIYNASGIVKFAQGAFVMLGGMVTHALLHQAGVPLAAAAVLATLFVALVGVVIERVVVRPLWDRNATMFVMILATLAAQIVIERLTLIVA